MLLLPVLALVAYVRGTRFDHIVRNPENVESGTLCQLYEDPQGQREVRCAAVLDHAPDKVWEVVTDYRHFGEIFAARYWTMTVTGVTREADGRFHLTGQVKSSLGDYPVDARIKHEESPGKWVASWDESGGRVEVNRGAWTIAPAGEGKSLVVYSLEVRVRPFPLFLIHDVLLSELKPVIQDVDRRLKQR